MVKRDLNHSEDFLGKNELLEPYNLCLAIQPSCLLRGSLEIGPLEEVFVGLNMWLICWFCCQTSKKCLGWFWCKCDQWPMPSIVEDVIGRLTSCNNFNRRLWPNMKNLEETTFVSNRHVIALLLTICFLHWLRSFGTWFWLTLLSKHSNVW